MTTYTLTTRTAKGSPLTTTEMDNNLTYFDNSKVVSVKDYGAVGDGVTDDTTALVAAFAASSGKILYFPNGTYLTSRQLDMRDGCSVIGAGWGSVIKTSSLSTSGEYGILHNYGALATQNLRLSVANIKLDGNSVAHNGIWIENAKHCRIDNVWVTGCGIVHASSNGGIVVAVENIHIDRCQIDTCAQNASGIWVTSTKLISGWITRNRITGCYIGIRSDDNTDRVHIHANECWSNRSNGISVVHCPRTSVVANKCWSNVGHGIHLGDATGFEIVGNECWSNTSGSGITVIRADTTTRVGSIVSNVCYLNSDRGIRVDTASNLTISGNVCWDNTTDGISGNTITDSTITGNTCQDNNQNGIWVFGTSNELTIVGNSCKSNGADGIAGTGTVTEVACSGNVCKSNAGYGVHTANSGDYWAVGANVLRSNTSGNLSLVGANNQSTGDNITA